MKKTDPIQSLKGIGSKTALLFQKLHIETVEDLLMYFPRDYEVYEEPVTIREAVGKSASFEGSGGIVSVYGRIKKGVVLKKKGNLTIAITSAEDIDGREFTLIWYNAPFVRALFHTNDTYIFRGRISEIRGNRVTFEQPEYFKPEDYKPQMGKMLPIYPLCKGISRKLLIKCVLQAIDNLPEIEYTEPVGFDDVLIREEKLLPLRQAIGNIHFPKNKEDHDLCRRSLCFREFYRFALMLRLIRKTYAGVKNAYPNLRKHEEVDRFVQELPYSLTGAQKRVWEEMRTELTGTDTMHRLLQGDVGSGKTIVAFLLLYETALSGYQGFLMAPTQVLAYQHYQNFVSWVEAYHLPLRIGFLAGSVSAKEKASIYRKLEDGELDIVIGTHALFQEKVLPEKLALVITDEQHRFGVEQRKSLTDKGLHPHVCVMSATPIPRTLGMILYGDLNISVIDEKPANRLPIKNCVVDIGYRPQAYRFIEKQIEAGHQAYVICSLVEESELMACTNVTDYAETVRSNIPGARVEILHGRMSDAEKNRIMQAFLEHSVDILVSTIVVEVGVDVPNATVMMIEDAQRFGLASLHQLRGRVGRGDAQSYCIFVQTEGSSAENDRLDVLNHSNDGFYIAEQDLKMRGPGQLFGHKQSGSLVFRIGDVFEDADVFTKAVSRADAYFSGLDENERDRLAQAFAGANYETNDGKPMALL